MDGLELGGRRKLAMVAALVALLMLSALGAAVQSSARDSKRPSSAAAKRGGVVAPLGLKGFREVRGERSRTSRTYENRRGERVARVFTESVHFRGRGKGRPWRVIDSRLRRQGQRFVNRANRFGISLPAEMGGNDNVRVRRGRLVVGFRLRGANGSAEVRGRDARYANVFPGVDAVYGARADGLKEELILRDAGTRKRFVFDLEMSKGLRPRVLKSKAVAFVDRRGRPRMSVPAPFMVDAKGRRSSAVRFDVTNINGRWRLTLVADGRWIGQAGRAFPVTVDPWVRVATDGDCYLDQNDPENTSLCALNEIKVAKTSGGVEQRAVLRFDIEGALPYPVDVEHALLGVKVKARGTENAKVEAHPLGEAFNGSASWNRNDGVDRWSEPGGETETRDPWSEDVMTTAAGAYHFFGIRKAAQTWVDEAKANHGIQLRAAETGSYTFHSSDLSGATPDPGNDGEPYLDIRYQPRVGDKRGYTHESWQLSDRISMKVNPATGSLMVSQTDFSMPGGLGPDVAVTRTYNSWDRDEGAYGQSWSRDAGQPEQLFAWGNEFATWRSPSGARFIFDGIHATPGTFKTPAGLDATLKRDNAAVVAKRFSLTEHGSQTKRFFDADGRLTSIEDRNGRYITYNYASTAWNAALSSIADWQGDQVTFTSASATKTTGMTDPASRNYSYGYDSQNRLTSYTDPQNGSSYKTLYEYAECDKLTKLTTPGGRITTIDYYDFNDPDDACRVKTVTRVTNETAMTGPTWLFEYRLRPDGSGDTKVTDPLGVVSNDDNDRVTRYEFDSQGRHTKSIDALKRETSRKITSTSKVESYSAASNGGTTPNTSIGYDGDDNAKSSNTPVNAGGVKSCADFGTPDPASGTDAEKRCDDPAPGATYSGGSYGGVDPNTVAGGAYLPGRMTNPQGNRTNFAYTSGGMPSTVQQTDKDGNQIAGVSMTYGNDTDDGDDTRPGRLTLMTDDNGNQTAYDYDGQGNVDVITPPNPGGVNPSGPTRLHYHPSIGRLEKVQDGKDNWRLMTYDNLDRLIKIEFTGADQTPANTVPCEPKVEFTYDRDGNQETEVSREQTTCTVRTRTMLYDKLNRVTSETLPNSASNIYTYDLVGNLRSLTDATGQKVEYTYDAANQQRAIYEPNVTKPTRFKHNKDGLREETKYPNGVEIDQKYDGAFRLTEINSHTGNDQSPLQKQTYTYKDPATNRETPLMADRTDTKLGHKTVYTYDALDRLKTATISTTSTSTEIAKYAYNLDDVGNILSRTITGTQADAGGTYYAYNSANQLCARSTTSAPTCPASSPSYTYDKNGNQVTAPSRAAEYNLLDQTTKLTISSSPTSLLYLGAGQDRWITEGSGSFQHNVLGLGKRTVGTSTDSFTRDEGGKPVSRRNGSTRHYYLFDALGSVTGLTNTSTPATVTERYDYEPYGTPAPRASGKWGATTAAADVANGQLGFGGGYRSVGGLYHYGQRFYDPADMRWTQPDPLDQAGDLRQGNRYVFAASDPISVTDPSGLVGGYMNFDCGVGIASGGVEYAENSRGPKKGKSDAGVKGGFSLGPRCGASAGIYTGTIDGNGDSAGIEACAVLCVGADSDKGIMLGIGPKVGIGGDADLWPVG